jgi:hypothetical protein
VRFADADGSLEQHVAAGAQAGLDPASRVVAADEPHRCGGRHFTTATPR